MLLFLISSQSFLESQGFFFLHPEHVRYFHFIMNACYVQLPESLSHEKIAQTFADAEANRVEVIMEQNAEIFALCSEIVWHLVLSETAPDNNHTCKSLRLGQQGEEPISVSP